MGKGSEHNDLIAYGPHREPAVSSVDESPQLIDWVKIYPIGKLHSPHA